MKKINWNKIDKKWQAKWEKAKIFKVTEGKKKKKYYVLEMFPYPSAYGLHMGHIRNYALGDFIARFKRMQGFNVLYPMGYDAFGLPAENAAIKNKTHPKMFTERAISSIMANQKSLGLSYDWSRTFATCYPEYYKWNQWFFLKFLEKGLAYKKEAYINWCPNCRTVLANEQVENGKCWRCQSEVEMKPLEQWFFRITAYADELLNDIEKLEWPERIKIMQKNWIGRSEGVEIFFRVADSDLVLPAFTTRCDTIFSVTFIVIAPEHPIAKELVKNTEYDEEFERIKKVISKQSQIERTTPEGKDKIGCFLGRYAINPVNGERIPIYVANFCLMDYGTGIVMADAHDQRDFEFARKYNIPLKFVISKDGKPTDAEKAEEAFVDNGILFNSGKFSGQENIRALPYMSNWLVENGWAKKTVNYKIRDWLISRQRYWGTPIPIVYCGKCGIVPVPEKELPIALPEDVKFIGKGNPIATSEKFVNTKCPKCKGKARRETDTMDTFVDSSWYFLRYCSPKSSKKPFEDSKVKHWLPVDQYIGGAEHAVMHLLYARFFTKVLRDLGLVNFGEPFVKLFNQGILTKDGLKMSKSYGNVVTQEEISNKYGIDTSRLFLLFVSSPDKEMEWSDKGVVGCYRFVNKTYNLITSNLGRMKKNRNKKLNLRDRFLLAKTYQTINEVAFNVANFEPNIALANIMKFIGIIEDYAEGDINRKVFEEVTSNLILILSPFAPHLSEELWEKMGNKKFVSLEKWPKVDDKKIEKDIIELDTFFRKTIEDLSHVMKLTGNKKNAYLYFITDKELDYFNESKKIIEKKFGLKVQAFKLSDPKKYDPQNKSSKAKYGKPGIYLE